MAHADYEDWPNLLAISARSNWSRRRCIMVASPPAATILLREALTNQLRPDGGTIVRKQIYTGDRFCPSKNSARPSAWEYARFLIFTQVGASGS